MGNYYGLFMMMLIFSLRGSGASAGSGLDHDLKIEILTNESHILIHDLIHVTSITKDIHVREQNQLSVLNITLQSNMKVQIHLRIRNALDQYKEVPHIHDENQFVLQSHHQSDIFHLRNPMTYIMENYCSRPLPKKYFIIKDTYKNRATLAYPEKCTFKRIQDNIPNECRHTNQTYYRRSVNEDCRWKKNNNDIQQDEEIEQLPYNLNSIFCVENSPLLANFFKEKMKRNKNIVLDPDCELARARCTDCQVLRCKSKKSCCTTTANCLLNGNCLKLHSVDCGDPLKINREVQEPYCVRDTTHKLTLMPVFDVTRKNFLCHLEREDKVASISGKISLHGTLGPNSLPFAIRFKGSFTTSTISISPTFKISIVPSMANKMKTVIFERRGYEYFMHSLKASRQFDKSTPRVNDHFSKSYVEIQFEKPFQYTTGTWSKEDCGMNTSSIHSSQLMYDRHSTVPIRLLHKPAKDEDKNGISSFHYTMLPVILDPIKISLSFRERSSVLSLLFCNQSIYKPPTNFALGVQLGDENAWILHIQGDFIEMSTFFTVSITDVEFSAERIFHSDILVTNKSSSSLRPQQFTLAFLISFTRLRKSVAQIEIAIHNCKSLLHKQLLFLKMKKKSPPKVDLTDIENPKDISNFLLAFFLSILSVCFLYFLLLALQAIRRSSRVPQVILPTKKRKTKETLNYIFLFKATLYLTFKLFYTVTFTLSLVLSVCLSLNAISKYSSSNVFPELSKDATNKPHRSNYTKDICGDLKVKTERNFLKKIMNILINDEHIRTNSSQSTQKQLLNIIKHNEINRTSISFDSGVRSMGRDVDHRLRNVLGHYARIYDQMSNLKWLSTFYTWNNSVTTVDFSAEYKDRYLNLFNLLKIYSATSIMENSNIFSQRISNFRHRLKFAINATPNVKSPLLSLSKGLHQRYFVNLANYETIIKLQKQEFPVYKESKNRNISSLDMVKVRVIFMFIDTVLIIYRFYWTFVNIQNMWKSKKEIVQLNQIKIKDCQNIYSECAKRSTLQWTKEHHLECLTSGHIAIATTIIVVSIICTNLIVLLTSKDHANWLSKISGNIIRVRTLKIMKERLSQFNTINVMPVQRHWEYLKTIKLKEIMTFRILSSKKMMNLELFFNKCYFYELCHFQKLVSPSPRAIDFCSSVMPQQVIVPENICGGPYNSPWPIYYNLTGFYYSKTVHYWNLVIHFSVHVLAIVILIAAFVGILKMFKKQIGNIILSSGHLTYAVYVTHDQYLAHFKNSLQMGIGLELSSIYNRSLNPHQHYQCWKNNTPKKNDTPF